MTKSEIITKALGLAWHEVGALIDIVNSGRLDTKLGMEWEAEEPLREIWIVEGEDGTFIRRCPNKDQAEAFIKSMTDAARIVHLREVRS